MTEQKMFLVLHKTPVEELIIRRCFELRKLVRYADLHENRCTKMRIFLKRLDHVVPRLEVLLLILSILRTFFYNERLGSKGSATMVASEEDGAYKLGAYHLGSDIRGYDISATYLCGHEEGAEHLRALAVHTEDMFAPNG